LAEHFGAQRSGFDDFDLATETKQVPGALLDRFDEQRRFLPRPSNESGRRLCGQERDLHSCVAQPHQAAWRDPHPDPQAAQLGLETRRRFLPGPGQVEPAWAPERSLAARQRAHARQPVDAHALLARGARQEVPRAGLEDEAQRLELAAHRAPPALVVDAQAAAVPHRIGNLAQEPRRVLRPVPVDRVHVQALADPGRLLAPATRQAGHHLQPGRSGGRAQPQLGGRPGQPGEEQGVGLGLGQAGEAGAPAFPQLKAALLAAFAPQRHAGSRELVDVAQDRALRHLHRLRQRRRRHPAARLQEHQDREQSAGLHGIFDRNMTVIVMLGRT
jgi:hypothetical protein